MKPLRTVDPHESTETLTLEAIRFARTRHSVRSERAERVRLDDNGNLAPAQASGLLKEKSMFKVAEIREDGTAIVELEDNRMVVARVKEGVEVKKGQTVTITSDGEDKGGAPTNVVVTKVVEKRG